jgi:hypothetical protein
MFTHINRGTNTHTNYVHVCVHVYVLSFVASQLQEFSIWIDLNRFGEDEVHCAHLSHKNFVEYNLELEAESKLISS